MQQDLHIGSLCTGYGGLDTAVMAVFGGTLAWCADNDRHVITVLAARYPDVPNLGDITTLNWRRAPPVDTLCAGFPCQDISLAGRGAGIKRGTRSGIWINIVEGIRLLRPKIVIVENVAAIRSRGLDRVLGDLATLGYDTDWTSLRASDIGAAHRRERIFVLAYRPADQDFLAAAYARSQRRPRRSTCRSASIRQASGGPQRSGDHVVSAGTAPADAAGEPRHLPDPAQPQWLPVAGCGGDRPGNRRSDSAHGKAWGRYAASIRRWEAITGRAAPYATEIGTKGQPRLSAAFSEWLMGLPPGFVTSLGLPYFAQHKIIGNGVVPQQAVAALRQLVRRATIVGQSVST